jgi:Rrf2 family protein
MLSNTSKYALRALIYLALQGDNSTKIGIKQISKELAIPMPFLGKIMQTLAKQKLLDSTKGPHGGFSLIKKPEDISLMEIVEIIDGSDTFSVCILGNEKCTLDANHCSVHQNYAEIRENLKNLFLTENLGEIASRFKDKSLGIVL